VAWLATAATILFTGSWALSPGPIDGSQPDLPNPYAPEYAIDLLGFITPIANLLALLAVGGAVAAAVVRFRRAGDVERQQLKWFGYATGVLLVALLTPIVLGIFVFRNFPNDTLLSGVLVSVGFPIVPLATGVAIFRHRLYDIDRLINRTLVYSTLTACIVALYVFVVGYLGTLFRTGDHLAISLIATGLVAALFHPLRESFQQGANRLLYGDRDDPSRALTRLGQRLQAAMGPDQVLPTVVTTLREALRLPYAAITFERIGASEVAAASGTPAGDVLRLPLAHGGETVGHLLLGPRDWDESTWSEADRTLLRTLAGQVGAAVHAARLTEGLHRLTAELQLARERLVVAREEERRRLRHDLHDELAPTLAGLSLTAATASDLLDTDLPTAKSLIADLKGSLRACVGDVRRLAYDLRPPVLDELGLLGAVQERARQYDGALAPGGCAGGAALRILVEAPEDLPPLPAAVEVAAYRILSEALMNVVRHARARTCTIRLAVTGADGRRDLEVEVADDGVGLPAGHRSGVGLRSMHERAAELGGTSVVQAGPEGGTRLRVRLPVGQTYADKACAA
jgi:signal transduction histidine kinase